VKERWIPAAAAVRAQAGGTLRAGPGLSGILVRDIDHTPFRQFDDGLK
jgi:hypothetical protein